MCFCSYKCGFVDAEASSFRHLVLYKGYILWQDTILCYLLQHVAVACADCIAAPCSRQLQTCLAFTDNTTLVYTIYNIVCTTVYNTAQYTYTNIQIYKYIYSVLHLLLQLGALALSNSVFPGYTITYTNTLVVHIHSTKYRYIDDHYIIPGTLYCIVKGQIVVSSSSDRSSLRNVVWLIQYRCCVHTKGLPREYITFFEYILHTYNTMQRRVESTHWVTLDCLSYNRRRQASQGRKAGSRSTTRGCQV